MKIPLALAVLILAVAAGLGWHGSHQLAALRLTRAQLIATAANRGIALDLSNPAAPGRGPKHQRENREASAKLIAAEFIAFAKEREAFEQTIGGQPDAAIQKQLSQRMADFRERLMAMDPAQLKILLAAVRSNTELSAETRRRLVAVSVLALANDHPQAVLALFTGPSELARDDHSGGYVVSSSLARWAKDDPLAALAWVRQNAGEFPEIITDDAKRGLLSGAAMQDPRLAFTLIGELDFKNPNDATQSIVGVAQTPDDKLVTLAALRDHLATFNDKSVRDEVAGASLTVLAGGFVQEGFAAAGQWLAAANLSPAELAGIANGLNYDPAKSAETGQWVEWLGATLSPDKTADRIQFLVASWTHNDPQAAGQWLASTPDGPARNTAVRSYAETIARYEPEVAAQWALTLPAGHARDTTLKTIYQSWPRSDPAAIEAAAAFAQQHGLN